MKNKYINFSEEQDHDPLSGMANLFDVAMVLAVALMVAFAVRIKMTEFLTGEDVAFVKNAGKKNMEIIVKKNNKVSRYKSKKSSGTGKGKRVGIAYQLDNGDIIYVPENRQIQKTETPE
jgi:hypothetical protein